MSAQSLQQNATHISKIKGITEGRTSEPQNSGVAGLKGGERYFNTTGKKSFVNTSSTTRSNWRYSNYTTTSTTTS
jgi:hypothetical protein